MKNEKNTISIVIPIHNGATTIEKTLDSLLNQSLYFDELIIVDDASEDNSLDLIRKFLDNKVRYHLICHKQQQGLAKTYNQGIVESSGDLVISVHQDIIFGKDALSKLVDPFSDIRIVAATHFVNHPIEIWNKYNFWQKYFFSRKAGKKECGMDGKFDCFRRLVLNQIGFFDEVNFRTAGEDGDLIARLKKTGRIVQTQAEIVHLHRVDSKFSWNDVVYKQKQYSEAQGALLRKGRMTNPILIGKSFFREILVMALFIPYLNIVSLVLIFIYSFFYTQKMFVAEYRNPKIILVPFLNIYLLFVSFFYSLKGFICGKQKL